MSQRLLYLLSADTEPPSDVQMPDVPTVPEDAAVPAVPDAVKPDGDEPARSG